MITADNTVAQLAREHPLSTRTFARYGIDFCCGGGRPLRAVCQERGLDPEAVVAEVLEDVADPSADSKRWDQEPSADLIDHILVAFHEPLREELPRLEAMCRKVNRVHHDKAPEQLSKLLDCYLALKDELEAHMLKEERVLFPMIKRGHGASAREPMACMEHEHVRAGSALKRIRALTSDFVAPEAACNTWRALWSGLEALEASLHQHIHLENNVLFPRAVEG
ncbi:iron-sulfur cluster repair di-iron protein [Planctomycetota bacterium]|nr:iron-sulfur cluster repair di-iron protein [Planctomycetota bacterium]